jgi:hypothetical protein
MVLYAVVLIVLMIVRPAGLFGENELIRQRAPPTPKRPPPSKRVELS